MLYSPQQQQQQQQLQLLVPPTSTAVNTLILDWKDDPEMIGKGGFDIIETLSPDGIYGLIDRGKQFGRLLEESGAFDDVPKQ
jgi:hypothetical protein